MTMVDGTRMTSSVNQPGYTAEVFAVENPQVAMNSSLAHALIILLRSAFPGTNGADVLPAVLGKPNKNAVVLKSANDALVAVGSYEQLQIPDSVLYLSVIAVAPEQRGHNLAGFMWKTMCLASDNPTYIATNADHPAVYQIISKTPGYTVHPSVDGKNVPQEVVEISNHIIKARQGTAVVHPVPAGQDLVRRHLYPANPQGLATPWQEHKLGMKLNVGPTDAVFVIGKKTAVYE